MFVIVPTVLDVTTTLTMALALAGSVPRLQVTSPLLFEQEPWLDAETNATPGGSALLTITPVASVGPTLLTVIV
jgi:hypothetical protein